MTELVSMSDVTAWYGPSQALFGVNLEIQKGEAVALMGRNGMGKTTSIRTLCSLLKPQSGNIRFEGTNILKLPIHKVAQLGIGLVPEGRRCFPNLTVEENLIAAATPGEWDIKSVSKLFPRLAERLGQYANTLSGGEQQMLAIGRALMTNPKLLVLDEATEGLAPVVRNEIWAAVTQLKQQSGLSLLIVDKTLKEITKLADRCTIVEKGATVWNGAPADLTAEISDRYLGV